MAEAITKPCEFCGIEVTKTRKEQGSRVYWTCSRSCANKQRIRLGHTPWASNPLRGRKDTRACANCGVPVTRYLSQVNNRKEWTCSRRCAGIVSFPKRVEAGTWKVGQKKRRGFTTACETCGTPVYANLSARSKGQGRYCSAACHNIAQTKEAVVKSCPVCGKEMRLKPSQAPRTYCSRLCMGRGRTKRLLDREHNGRPARLDQHGYVLVWQPDYPGVPALKGWVYEHRLVASQVLGRPLTSDEQVDHINRDKGDNRPENLQVLDQNGHALKTQADQRHDRLKLAEYARRYGPLEDFTL